MTEYSARIDHTSRAFDSDLQEIARKVAEMGGLVEKQIADATRSLLERDTELAERVIATDGTIDSMQQVVEEKAILTIARRQPMAVDLREIVGAMRVANDLERIGDHAKHIGKRVVALGGDLYPQTLIRGVDHMAELVLAEVKQVLDAYGSRDLQAALAVWSGDAEVYALCTSLFRELLTYMMEDPRNITFCIHLMFCAKNIERMGDHATNIAETVHYIIEGRPIADQRRLAGRRHQVSSTMSARILIVEDEEPLTMLLRYNLESEGYEVETAARGDEADTRLKESTPDLVVLDWMLPGLSGIELCRRLRARPETRQLPIIMLTARGEESEKVRGLATGADDYIVKPFSVLALLLRVRALLRRANPERVAMVLNIGDIELDREKKRVSQRARDRPRTHRIPAAGILDGAPWPRVFTRATARRRLGQRHLYRRADGGRAC